MGTKYIKPAGQGGDYTSLAAWEAQNLNLVALQEIENAIIDGDWSGGADTTAVLIDGWTTSAQYYINIYTTPQARHDGKWNTGKYRLVPTSGIALVIGIATKYARVDGLQIQAVISTESFVVWSGANAEIRISNIIFKGASNASGLIIGFDSVYNTVAKVWNCIAYDFSGSYAFCGAYGTSIYMYNCTAVDSYRGFHGSIICKNCLGKGNTVGDFLGLASADYCASGDATADDFGGTGNRINQTFTFVNEAGDDFHLASNDAGARNYGADLSNDANLAFSDDIDGQTRPGESVWDIGADEYIPEGIPISVLMQNMRGGFVRARGGFVN